MPLSSSQTTQIRNYLATQPVLKAFVFGSMARGDDAANSDLDLLVELDYSKPIGLRFIDMKLDLEKMMGRPVDLVSAKGVSKHILPHINQGKVLIYERENF